MKLYKFFHFCAKQKRMCNSLVPFFNLREAALSIIFYHKIIILCGLFNLPASLVVTSKQRG